MARVTVEDCLDKVSSRFDLVLLASIRAKQLLKGAKPVIKSDNRDIVIALREIAATEVDPMDDNRGSADYKREMVKVLVRRAVQEALQRAS